MVLRPDTRMLWGVTIDSVAFRQTMEAFQAALPNEVAVCYTGVVRDTAFEVSNGLANALLLIIDSATVAPQDSADRFHVYGPTCPNGTIAVGHSHPYATFCDQSDQDARLLFNQRKALVSIIWCLNGETQILYQDGRRNMARWRAP